MILISGLVGDWTMVFVAHGAMLILAGGVALLLASFKEPHKPTVFFESEKEQWLEKVRPIANDLNFPEDGQDNLIRCP